jgi:hypothetical protein
MAEQQIEEQATPAEQQIQEPAEHEPAEHEVAEHEPAAEPPLLLLVVVNAEDAQRLLESPPARRFDLVIGHRTWWVKVRDIIAAIHSGSIRLHSLSVPWAMLYYPGLEGKLESAGLTGNRARVHYYN